MKAEELRIGNLVKQGSVGALDNLQAWTFTDGVVLPVEYKELTPIPLTEEWLVRFGFEKKGSICNDECYELNGFYIWKYGSDFSCGNVSLGGKLGYSQHPSLEHVHQLQNLYHALTGEELTLNETI